MNTLISLGYIMNIKIVTSKSAKTPESICKQIVSKMYYLHAEYIVFNIYFVLYDIYLSMMYVTRRA